MMELKVFTTDAAFVDDINGAAIEGVRAAYRPTAAYDSAEHLFEIVLGAATSVGLKSAADLIIERFKKKPPSRLEINGTPIVNHGDNVTIIVNQVIQKQEKLGD